MGVCNSTNEKENKPKVVNYKSKRQDTSMSQTKSSFTSKDKMGDYIISPNIAIHTPLSNK